MEPDLNANEFPSSFYSLVEGAPEAVLEFPVDGDSGGPFWSDDGELDLVRCKEWDREEVRVVPLGGNRYRLAERRFGPFSVLTLYWGDEFNADKRKDGALRLTSICVPQSYAHFRFLASGRFDNEHELARHLHSLGGGWETVAGGMLTLTVPAEHAGELQRLMYEQGATPGAIPLGT
jgi:hypothetical protein